jgi:hypothetical protein
MVVTLHWIAMKYKKPFKVQRFCVQVLGSKEFFPFKRDGAKPPARRGCNAYASESDTGNIQSSIFNPSSPGLGY